MQHTIFANDLLTDKFHAQNLVLVLIRVRSPKLTGKLIEKKIWYKKIASHTTYQWMYAKAWTQMHRETTINNIFNDAYDMIICFVSSSHAIVSILCSINTLFSMGLINSMIFIRITSLRGLNRWMYLFILFGIVMQNGQRQCVGSRKGSDI